ncbi:PI-PLC domain-containing protein [Flavobacterium chungangense]|uniref:hypothetical protein n=3 Tax=Flavobacterium chungangense TaxID=554283 RepID=UPI0004DF84A3|nr:hypothetical protein [Flavobacterium chungangense]
MRKNHANWMGDLMNNNSPFINHPLNSIIIPGTHDSGTMTLDTRARTQTLNIKEQLEHGVRYFDFRIKLSGNKYYFHHTLCSDDVLCEKKIDFTTPKSDYALHQIRNFLIEQPNEIIILKFQNFLNLTIDDDYVDLVNLLVTYLEFNDPNSVISKCGLVQYKNSDTIQSLNNDGKRVFVFFDVENVPIDAGKSASIWSKVNKYSPLLKKGTGYDLWDPFWGDDSSLSVKDTDVENVNNFWEWHNNNIQTWANNGFYVLQSHMQTLHGSGNGSNPIYYNIAEQAADATYYLENDITTGDFISNNARNINHYIDLIKKGTIINIVQFDYIQHGGVMDAIINYYTNPTNRAPQPLHFQKPVYLKLNNLNRYIGYGSMSHSYLYPLISENEVFLKLVNFNNNISSSQIHDGDEILICTSEQEAGTKNQISVYQTNDLYYYNANSDHEKWIIYKDKKKSVINDGDYVWFENAGCNILRAYGIYLTTEKMTKPTRWIISIG